MTISFNLKQMLKYNLPKIHGEKSQQLKNYIT